MPNPAPGMEPPPPPQRRTATTAAALLSVAALAALLLTTGGGTGAAVLSLDHLHAVSTRLRFGHAGRRFAPPGSQDAAGGPVTPAPTARPSELAGDGGEEESIDAEEDDALLSPSPLPSRSSSPPSQARTPSESARPTKQPPASSPSESEGGNDGSNDTPIPPAVLPPLDAYLARLGWVAADDGLTDRLVARGDAVFGCVVRPVGRSGGSDNVAPPTASTDDVLDPASWYADANDAAAITDDDDERSRLGRLLRPYLRGPPAAWDLPPGAAHPLSMGATDDWVRQQAAWLRRAMARTAAADVRRNATLQADDSDGAYAANAAAASVFDGAGGGVLRLGPEDGAGADTAGRHAYQWPVPDLLPLPAVVRAGGRARVRSHPALVSAMRRYLRAQAGLPLTAGDAATAPTARLRRALATLPLAEGLRRVQPTLRLPSPAVDVEAHGAAMRQPWLAPVVRFVIPRSTLAALAPAELRSLARGVSRTCADMGRSQAAADWSGALLLTGALLDSGCGADADAASVMAGGASSDGARLQQRRTQVDVPVAAARAVADGTSATAASPAAASQATLARIARTWRRRQGAAGDDDYLRPAAVIPSHRLWKRAPEAAVTEQGVLPPLLLDTVTVQVLASDKRAVAHIAPPSGSGSGVEQQRALTDAQVAQLLQVVTSVVPPSTRGDAATAALLADTEARLRALQRPTQPRSPAVGAYDDVPLPWQGQAEAYLLTIGAVGAEGQPAQVPLSSAAEARLQAVVAGGAAPSRAPTTVAATPAGAEVEASTVWGALRGLRTLAQAVQSWGLADAADDDDDGGSSVTHNDAAALMAALGDDAPQPLPSTSIASLVTQLSRHCALRVLTEHRQRSTETASQQPASGLGAPTIPDPSRPLPVAMPLVVADAPWRQWRGLSVDTARHYLPLPTVYRLVDAAAAAGASVLHWHIVDAQSWPLELASLPTLAPSAAWGGGNWTYSRADVTGLVRYAADRGLRVVPEVDAPSHTRAFGRSPETDGAVVPCHGVAGGDVHDWDKYALDPTSPATYARLAVALAEVGALFPDAHLHVGADEVVADCWAAEPRLYRWAEAHLPALMGALASVRDWRHGRAYLSLLAHFLHSVHGVLGALGKDGVSWGDSHEMMTSGEEAAGRLGRRPSPGPPPSVRRHRSLLELPAPGSGNASSSVGDGNGAGMPALQLSTAQLRLSLARGLAHMRRREPVGAPRHRARRLDGEPADAAPPPPAATTPPPAAAAADDSVDGAFGAALADASHPHHGRPLVGFAYDEGTAMEAWKCWEAHGDNTMLAAAEDAYGRFDAAGIAAAAAGSDDDGDTGEGTGALPRLFPARPVVNAACTYLDYDPTWVEYARKWPLPEGVATMGRLGRLMQARWPAWAGNATIGSSSLADRAGAAPSGASAGDALLPFTLSTLLFSPWPYAGGEATIWTERMDGTNVAARTLPRGIAALEVFASQSLAVDRVARALAAAGERATPATATPLPATRARRAAGGLPFPVGWAGRLDDPGVQSPQWRLTAVRLLRFTTHSLWARGVGASPLAVFALSDAPWTGGADVDGLLPPPEGAAAAAAGQGEAAAPAPALSTAPFKRLSPNERDDTPPHNGVAPSIEQAVQRRPDHVPQPVAAAGGVASPSEHQQSPPCPFPSCRLRFLLWNIDNGGGDRRLQRRLVDEDHVDADGGGGGGGGGCDDSLVDSCDDDNDEDDDSLNTTVSSMHTTSGARHGRSLGPAGRRWAALSALLTSGAEAYDVVAVVEAVAWDTGRARRARQRRLTWQAQTAAFRRRAAALGYPFAHLLAVASGYHVALLSAAPIAAVLEERGALFERGLLVADTAGVRWAVGHLHAHDPVARAREAAWVAELGRRYTGAGLPVVFTGDANSLSPLDTACHEALDVAGWLSDAATPAFLRTKFSRRAHDGVEGGGSGGDGSRRVPDYRPLAALLAPAGPFADAVAPTGLAPAADGSCAGRATIPTSFATDDHGARPLPPLRIDQVFVNAVLQQQTQGGADDGGVPPPAACTVLRRADVAELSDHFPVACEWAWGAQAPPSA